MREPTYSPLHDSGTNACKLGECCRKRRERAFLEQEAATYVPGEERQQEIITAACQGLYTPPSWVDVLMHLLTKASVSTLSDICEILGISRSMLMSERRRYEPLEISCRDYMAGVIEDEVESGTRRLPASVLLAGMERLIPTYAKVGESNLSEEDVLVIVRTIVDSIRTRLATLGMEPDEYTALVTGISGDIIHAFTMRTSQT